MVRPDVEVRRSERRHATVSASREGDRIIVVVPAALTAAEEDEAVAAVVEKLERAEVRARLSDDDLLQRALNLNDAFLGGLATPESVRWVANQRTRWGSCTPGDRAIRLSMRLQGMPGWVIDYVLVHELVHLLEPGHDARFWAWVEHYPHAAKARGYLLGWSEASRILPPPHD